MAWIAVLVVLIVIERFRSQRTVPTGTDNNAGP
jgi:hypothetical protein